MKRLFFCVLMVVLLAGCEESRQQKVDRLFRHTPGSAEAYLDRARSFKQLGEPFHAVADLTKAIRLNPSYIQAYRERADFYVLQDRDQEALADILMITRLDPADPAPSVLTAMIRIKQGMYSTAVEELNIAIKKDENFAPSYAWKGYLYHYNGNLDRAVQLYNKFLSLEQNTPLAAKVNYDIGKIYFVQGKWDKCEFHWRESQRIEPRPNLDNWINLIQQAKAAPTGATEIPREIQERPSLR